METRNWQKRLGLLDNERTKWASALGVAPELESIGRFSMKSYIFIVVFLFLQGCAGLSEVQMKSAQWLYNPGGMYDQTEEQGKGTVQRLMEQNKEFVHGTMMDACMRYAFSNWALERPSLAETYREVENRVVKSVPLTPEVRQAINLACSGDQRLPQGMSMTWKCSGDTNECNAKERLAKKLEDLVITGASDEEAKTQIASFLSEARRLGKK